MSPARIRRHSWRYYRNWLFALLVLVLWFLSYFVLKHSPLHLIWIAPACYLGLFILHTISVTHPTVRLFPGKRKPAGVDLECERVEFPSQDGLELSGWFTEATNGAAVVLVHGASGQGLDMIHHASALTRRGYGVLMLDLRAHGRSGGDTCTWGWLEADDVLAAASYLQRLDGVDASKIGALGVSLGAQAALWAAARSTIIGAVVAEGAGPALLADHAVRPAALYHRIKHPVNRLFYELRYLIAGARPQLGVADAVRNISPHSLLLISTGRGQERDFARLLFEAAHEPKEIWELPEAQHSGGFFVYPNLYAQKVADFFDAALQPWPAIGEEQP